MDPIRIDSLNDPRVAPYANVRDAHLLRDRPTQPGSLLMAEGEVVFRQLLRSRYRPASVLLTPTRLRAVSDALERLDPATPVYLAEQDVMDRIAGFHIHRGLLAAVVRAPEPSLPELLNTRRPIVVLEDLANHDNLGGIFRNAAAFGAGGVLLSPRCADPLYRKSLRVSVGHALTVPFTRLEPWPEGLKRVRAAGFHLAGLSPRSEALDVGGWARSLPPGGRAALLAGAEGPGLTDEAAEYADSIVRIPIATCVDSLNVATSVAIALHRVAEAGHEQSQRPGVQ